MKKSHEKALPFKASGEQFSWCPTMDLLAVMSSEGHASIYRANGQRVWSFFSSKGAKICWSPDGKNIAVVSSNNGYQLFDVTAGRFVIGNQRVTLSLNEHGTNLVKDVPINSVSWTQYDSSSGFGPSKALSDPFHFKIELLKNLPRLSNFPGTGSSSHALASKVVLKALNSYEHKFDNISMVCYSNALIGMTLNELFMVNPVKYDSENVDFIQVQSDPSFVRHYILSKVKVDENSFRYGILPLELPFFKGSNVFLQTVVSNNTKSMLLLLYIKETLNLIKNDCSTFLSFHDKMLEMLKSCTDNDQSFSGLFELLLTEVMPEDLKNWLENSLGDKNLKKWQKLGDTSVDQLKHKILTLLVPACERLILVSEQLGACVQWQKNKGKTDQELFGLTQQSIKLIVDVTKSLIVESLDFVVKLNLEKKLFDSFVSWLSTIIEELKDEDNYKGKETNNYVLEISEYIGKHLDNKSTFEFGTIDGQAYFFDIKRVHDSISEKLRSEISEQFVFKSPILFGEIYDYSSTDTKVLTKLLDNGEILCAFLEKSAKQVKLYLVNENLEVGKDHPIQTVQLNNEFALKDGVFSNNNEFVAMSATSNAVLLTILDLQQISENKVVTKIEKRVDQFTNESQFFAMKTDLCAVLDQELQKIVIITN